MEEGVTGGERGRESTHTNREGDEGGGGWNREEEEAERKED